MNKTRHRAGFFRRTILICVIAIGLLASPFAHAQFGTASIAGVVEDATGARVPSADLKLINELTGSQNTATTSHDGSFLLAGIIPGTYTLEIERQGFATAQITEINLAPGDARNLLIHLSIGPVTEVVHIDAEGITLNRTDASVGTTVHRRLIQNIPLNGRSFQDLITMAPGVLTQSPQAIANMPGTSGGLSVNGQATSANYFLVDGVSANFGTANLLSARKTPADGSLPGLTALGTTQSLAPVDALHEFRILSANYSAKYGGAPGGQFILKTRSGEGSIHGSVYEYARNNAIDSVDWFSNYDQSIVAGLGLFNHGDISFLPYNQNDFGGTIGFPAVFSQTQKGRDRTFFFGSFDKLHVYQPTAFVVQFVPSQKLRTNAPVPLQPALNDFIYAGEQYPGPPILSPLLVTDSLPASVTATSIRLDRKLSSRNLAFFRYSDSPSSSETRNLSSLSATHLDNQTMTLGLASQISTTKSNDLHLGYARSSSRLNTSLGGFQSYSWTPTDLLSDLGFPSSYTSARGQVYIHIPTIGESTIDVDQAASALHQWDVRDVFSLQAGRHFLQFGIDQRRIASSVNPAPLTVEADFFDANSLLSNRASDVNITKTEPAHPIFNEFAAFLQDEWHIAKPLTLSAGLRWEVDPPPHGANGADAYTLSGNVAHPATLRLAPRGTPLWHTSWFNFAPRLGIAWSPVHRHGRELVLRGGAGIFFDTDNQPAAEAFNALGFSATAHLQNVPVPITAGQLNFSTTPAAPYIDATVFAFPRHLQLPYTFQWNVSVEQALGRSQRLTASWVGAESRRLLREQRRDINSLNSNFGEINSLPGGVTSNYQSLQVEFQRTISAGVQALASYVWSHAIDYGSTAPEFPLTRGNSDLDVRQNFQGTISWQEAPLSGNWIRRHLLGGWEADGRVAARTGFPINLMGNLFSDPATGDRYYSGVNLVPGRPFYLRGSQYPGGRILNGGPNASNPAFTLPQGSTPGDAPRNLVRDFGQFQINAAISHEIHLSGRFQLHLRAEAFNIFNHPELGYIDPVLSNELFGQATLLLNQSFGSAGPLYEPGGPRSLQFSGRLHF